MALPIWFYPLVILGLAALIWGIVSLRAKSRQSQSQTMSGHRDGSGAPSSEPGFGSPRASTSKIREIIAIIGGVISIVVGLLTIMEKLGVLNVAAG